MNRPESNIWSFFDLDGTLINKDSFLYFLLAWKLKHPENMLSLLSLPIKLLFYLTNGQDRHYIKEASLTAFMRGAKRYEIERFIDNFWDKFLPKNINGSAVEKLYWHYQNRHKVYIVTASLDFYTNHLKKIWPVNGVISTETEWNDDVLTGKLKGKNCKGNEKVKRIEEELKIDLKHITYYAYTDSKSDLPLLKYATYPILVKSNKLETLTN